MLTPVNTDQLPLRHLFGTPIHALSMTDVIGLAQQAIDERRRLLVGVVNAAKLVNMRKSDLLRESVLSADVVLADGMSVVWACRLLGRSLSGRVAGINLMHGLLGLADRHRHRVYCLGARQEVVETVVRRIGERYPNAEIAGFRNGYFTPEEEPAIVEAIKSARPDMLFVGISPPKKEQFLARWSDALEVPVCHGVGGSFDVMAGRTKRAPRFMQAIGMEWLYRLLQEPRRLAGRYFVTNTLFLLLLLGEVFLPAKAPTESLRPNR